MKRIDEEKTKKAVEVAPRRGAWIETTKKGGINMKLYRRTPQGCVD